MAEKAQKPVETRAVDFVIAQKRPALIASLFQGFLLFDRALQRAFTRRGWPQISRTESQILIMLGTGLTRQKDIAAMLGLTPQAINQSSNNLVEKGLIALETDPADRRQRIITIPEGALGMHLDATAILTLLEAELVEVLGETGYRTLRKGLDALTHLDASLSDSAIDATAQAIAKAWTPAQ